MATQLKFILKRCTLEPYALQLILQGLSTLTCCYNNINYQVSVNSMNWVPVGVHVSFRHRISFHFQIAWICNNQIPTLPLQILATPFIPASAALNILSIPSLLVFNEKFGDLCFCGNNAASPYSLFNTTNLTCSLLVEESASSCLKNSSSLESPQSCLRNSNGSVYMSEIGF